MSLSEKRAYNYQPNINITKLKKKRDIWHSCSDHMNWGIYVGYCCWDGDYILYAKQVADSGPGSPSDSTLSS